MVENDELGRENKIGMINANDELGKAMRNDELGRIIGDGLEE
jgi:hypothetical protein